MKTKIIPVKFAGGIIKTLTEELPDNASAFRELIKNAYDASADTIEIRFDSAKHTLTITDDGNGMNRDELEKLFHVGRSKKKYGRTFTSTRSKEKRFFQGSKGIGFLSAMHFGNYVTWTSTKENGKTLQIKCDKAYLETQKNMEEAKLEMEELPGEARGTRITIDLDEYHAKTVESCLSDMRQLSKIGNTFHKSSFQVKVYKDNILVNYEHVDDFVQKNDNNIFYVTISSQRKNVIIRNGKKKIAEFDVNYDVKQFKIDGEISILMLGNGHSVDNTSTLFINDNNSLTPLIFINDNLHEEYRLFDPEIMRKIRGTKTLPQMIGYIDITCNKEELRFTPDRSRLVRNTLSDQIKSALLEINTKIQEVGSAYKSKHIKDNDFLVGFRPLNNKVFAAYIQSYKEKKIAIPSRQIKLANLVSYSRDSQGHAIPSNKLKIKVDGKENKLGVLSSQTTPCSKLVQFIYDDPITGTAIEECKLVFCSKAELAIKTRKAKLMGYSIDEPQGIFMEVCSLLQKEINELHQKFGTKYMETIACSLRSVFELATASVYNNPKAPDSMRSMTTANDVIPEFLSYLSIGKNCKKVSEKCIFNFTTLNNIRKQDFQNPYELSHLGAHRSSACIDLNDIASIAKKASLLAYLINAMLKDDN